MNMLSTAFRVLFLLVVFFILSFNSSAQKRVVHTQDFKTFPSSLLKSNLQIKGNLISTVNKNQIGRFFSEQIALPEFQNAPFIALSTTWEGENLDNDNFQVMFITSQDGKNWDNWIPLNKDGHVVQGQNINISKLQFIKPESRFFRYYLYFEQESKVKLETLRFHFYNPGKTAPASNETPSFEEKSISACPCPQPDFQGREDWCPTGDCPPPSSPATTPVSHLIVHHSAGSNIASDWAAVVRSIWDYHVNTNGWGDIGYNWLIDPLGVLYEGRGKDIQGAHFCEANFGTMGVCMIGTYTTEPPSGVAQNTLVEFLGWNSCHYDLDPLGQSFHTSTGLTLKHISGHRDGCATECPGESLYLLFEEIREQVSEHIENDCSEGQPDLIVENILTSPNQIETDSEVSFVAKIKNIGLVNSSTIFVDHYLDNALLEIDTLNGIAPGQFAFATVSDYVFQFGGDYDYCVNITSQSEESDTLNNSECFNIQVNGMTATKESIKSDFVVEVFPNPGNGFMTLIHPFSDPVQMSVFDTGGKIIYESGSKLVNGSRLDLNLLPDGLYIVKITSQEVISFVKIIIQK